MLLLAPFRAALHAYLSKCIQDKLAGKHVVKQQRVPLQIAHLIASLQGALRQSQPAVAVCSIWQAAHCPDSGLMR